tara:strand:+ start:1088 stop:2401 length:1314 start_codon:yes stop_codon:yes gene_type:complete
MKGLKSLTLNNYLVTENLLADILSVPKAVMRKRREKGDIFPVNSKNGVFIYDLNHLGEYSAVSKILNSRWDSEAKTKPRRRYRSIELFAGAGGMAIGLENAGFKAIALNEFAKDACETLRMNRPKWNVLEGDIADIDFKDFENVDFVAGGFPCQAFSYAGNKLGFEDTRGTLFFEFARVIKETNPKVFLGENVRGLLTHEKGRTLSTIRDVIEELGYTLIEPKVLKAIFYRVPQKRERLFLLAVRNDLVKFGRFKWPDPYHQIPTVRDALKAGSLYDSDVPKSEGQTYPPRKKEILSHVPPGGFWKDLPDELQREYMKGSYFLGGGKTGMARRLSMDEPSLTLTCAPAQKQTERCHPVKTRPLTIREYARIQTFPDEWEFHGSVSSQYKQIGNAVPVNLAEALGRRIVALLNNIQKEKAVASDHPESISPKRAGMLF